MTSSEFARLQGFWYAKQHSPTRLLSSRQQGKRSVKGRGKGVGCILKTSRVQSQVNIERVFVRR
jgi:hypothetical protein